jgi:hypothetical protein
MLEPTLRVMVTSDLGAWLLRCATTPRMRATNQLSLNTRPIRQKHGLESGYSRAPRGPTQYKPTPQRGPAKDLNTTDADSSVRCPLPMPLGDRTAQHSLRTAEVVPTLDDLGEIRAIALESPRSSRPSTGCRSAMQSGWATAVSPTAWPTAWPMANRSIPARSVAAAKTSGT